MCKLTFSDRLRPESYRFRLLNTATVRRKKKTLLSVGVVSEQMHDLGPVMTIPEVSEILRVHPSTIRRLIKRGDFPGFFKIGDSWRVTSEALVAWLAERNYANPIQASVNSTFENGTRTRYRL